MLNKIFPVTVTAGLAVLLAGSSWGAVPAPPVNQTLGFLDTVFATSGLQRTDCLAAGCHMEAGIQDRHHLLYNSTLPSLTVIPYIELTTNYPTMPYQYNCLGCHSETFFVETNCMNCHGTFSDGSPSASPHHQTALANAGNCQACHGALVDNQGDGHYIPTYAPSLVTPTPSQGDANQLNAYGNGAGACDYCHDQDTMPPAAPVTIYDNFGTHHGINLINFGIRCDWCHYMGNTPPSPIPANWYADNQPGAIRGCENCHGPDSLHNIQADSNGDGVIEIGGELAGYGHVGRDAGPNDSDCWGCHGFAGIAGAAPGSGPLVPTVYGSDATIVNAGAASAVTVDGAALTNLDGTVAYLSEASLTGADGTSVVLAPDSISQGSMTVTIPADTAPGNYDLQAVKVDNASNPVVISVIPQAAVTGISCDGNTATISGSGFSGYQAGSGTEVTGTVVTGKAKNRVTTTETGSVVSWNDTQIVADFSACPNDVSVTTVFSGGSTEPPAGSCADFTDETTCSADLSCEWSIDKKGRGSCVDVGGGSSDGGNGGGKNK